MISLLFKNDRDQIQRADFQEKSAALEFTLTKRGHLDRTCIKQGQKGQNWDCHPSLHVCPVSYSTYTVPTK